MIIYSVLVPVFGEGKLPGRDDRNYSAGMGEWKETRTESLKNH